MALGIELPQRAARMSALRLVQVASLLVPLLVACLWGVVSWNIERNRTFERAETSSQLLREYVLRVFEMQQSLLIEAEYLIRDVDVATVDQETLHQLLQPLVGRLQFTLGVGVIAPDGTIAGSTSYPVSGNAKDRTYFRKLAAREAEQYVERVTIGEDVEALLLARRRTGTAFQGALVAAVDVDAVTEFFARIAGTDGGSASMVGTDGSLLLRYPPASMMRLPADTSLMSEAGARPSGSFEAEGALDDVSRVYGFSSLGSFPVFVLVGEPSRMIYHRWWSSFSIILALLAAGSALAIAAATQASMRLSAEERQRQLTFDRRLLAEAQRAAESRTQLLREAHHRIKNNLQLVMSMLRSRARELGDPHILSNIEARVHALSELHDQLYSDGADGSKLDLGEFLQAICRNPSIVQPELKHSISCHVTEMPVTMSKAVPIALLAVEAICNSLKHAFPDGRTGEIRVELQGGPDAAALSILDNGIGLPPPEERSRHSGLKLIEALAAQVQGDLDVVVDRGTRLILRFSQGDEGVEALEPPLGRSSGPAAEEKLSDADPPVR